MNILPEGAGPNAMPRKTIYYDPVVSRTWYLLIFKAKFLMNVLAPTLGDGTRNVLHQLVTTSFLGQPNMRGAHGKTALAGTNVCALAVGKLLRTRRYLPQRLIGSRSITSKRKDQAMRPKLQIICSRRLQSSNGYWYSEFCENG